MRWMMRVVGVVRADGDRLGLEVAARSSVCVAHSGCAGLPREEPALPGSVVLAQRVAHERVVHEQPPEVRVPGETEAQKIVSLPLEPVGCGPDLVHGGKHEIRSIGEEHLDAQVLIPRDRAQVENRFEAGRSPLPAQVVHAGQVEEEVEAALRVIAQETGEGQPVIRSDLEGGKVEIPHLHPRGDRRPPEPLPDSLGGRRQNRRFGDRHPAGLMALRAERESRDFSPDSILRFSSRIPYISSSGVGGQPGT